MHLTELKPEHENKLTEFFLGLKPESLKLMNRFGLSFNLFTASSLAKEQVNKFEAEEKGFVALIKNQVVGYCFLRFDVNPQRKHLANLGLIVLDSFQGKGIGKKLLRFSLLKAKQIGLKKVWLNVREDNVKARHLYELIGFRIEGLFLSNVFCDSVYFDEVSMSFFLEDLK